jgi:signal peptidase I
MLIIGCLLMLLYKEELAKSFHAIETTITAVVIVLIIQTFFLGNYVVPTASMSPTIEPKDRFFANMVLYKFTHPKKGDVIAFKEPKDNKVMYTKRLIGEPGQTLQVAEDGKLMINGSYSGLPVAYEKDGILGGDKIYIPKKGDKVKLDKIIMIGKGVGKDDNGNDAIGTDWSGLQIADRHKEITAEEFLNIVGTKKNLQQYIANDSSFNKDDINDMKNNTYFLYTLKVEGRDEKILPILDFKYDSAKLEKLLSGETLTLDHDYYIAMGDNTKNSLDSRYWGYVQDNRIKGKILVRFWPLYKFGLIK